MPTLTGFVLIASVIGNIAFGFKSLSQVIKCFRSKSVYGISPLMLILDFIGNIGCGYSIYMTTGFTLWPQFVNYFCATLFLLVLFAFMFFYRKKKETLVDAYELEKLKKDSNLLERMTARNKTCSDVALHIMLEDANTGTNDGAQFTIVDGHLHKVTNKHIQHNED